jgi:hypothetical protein
MPIYTQGQQAQDVPFAPAFHHDLARSNAVVGMQIPVGGADYSVMNKETL